MKCHLNITISHLNIKSSNFFFFFLHPTRSCKCTHMFMNTHRSLGKKKSSRCFQYGSFQTAPSPHPYEMISHGVYLLRFLSCRLVELILPSMLSTLLSKESRETSWSSISICSPSPRFFSLPRPNDISSRLLSST